jgi:hypothetical protein
MRAWGEAPAQAALELEPAEAALPLRPELRGEAGAAGQFVARMFKLNLRPALGAWF